MHSSYNYSGFVDIICDRNTTGRCEKKTECSTEQATTEYRKPGIQARCNTRLDDVGYE